MNSPPNNSPSEAGQRTALPVVSACDVCPAQECKSRALGENCLQNADEKTLPSDVAWRSTFAFLVPLVGAFVGAAVCAASRSGTLQWLGALGGFALGLGFVLLIKRFWYEK
ncbi:MAG: hypothetical protein Q4D38_14255 [Planctomycetia bacterium]|nr:hypothetical protein [Planctomycetia bacterium]